VFAAELSFLLSSLASRLGFAASRREITPAVIRMITPAAFGWWRLGAFGRRWRYNDNGMIRMQIPWWKIDRMFGFYPATGRHGDNDRVRWTQGRSSRGDRMSWIRRRASRSDRVRWITRSRPDLRRRSAGRDRVTDFRTARHGTPPNAQFARGHYANNLNRYACHFYFDLPPLSRVGFLSPSLNPLTRAGGGCSQAD